MDIVEKISQELQARGQKITRQRLAVMEVLARSDIPLTVEEIFLKVRAAGENSSLATVYRNLKILLENGLVSREGLLEDKALYRLCHEKHCHDLICLGCRKVVKIEECPLGEFVQSIGQKEGFQVTEHRMALYGYCRDFHPKKQGED
jgi:Fur family ferric uptake transcriptional regulator